MSQIKNQLKWCLREEKRLKTIPKNKELALKHFSKSEKNFEVLINLEKLNHLDWATTVGFYCVYHCFLAILATFGFSSKNQTCTLVVMLTLIKNKIIDFDEDIVKEFDVLEPEKNLESSTIRNKRELSTYGIETSINLDELSKLKDLIIKTQKETLKNII